VSVLFATKAAGAGSWSYSGFQQTSGLSGIASAVSAPAGSFFDLGTLDSLNSRLFIRLDQTSMSSAASYRVDVARHGTNVTSLVEKN
jgi:hypothetical protein